MDLVNSVREIPAILSMVGFSLVGYKFATQLHHKIPTHFHNVQYDFTRPNSSEPICPVLLSRFGTRNPELGRLVQSPAAGTTGPSGRAAGIGSDPLSPIEDIKQRGLARTNGNRG